MFTQFWLRTCVLVLWWHKLLTTQGILDSQAQYWPSIWHEQAARFGFSWWLGHYLRDFCQTFTLGILDSQAQYWLSVWNEHAARFGISFWLAHYLYHFCQTFTGPLVATLWPTVSKGRHLLGWARLDLAKMLCIIGHPNNFNWANIGQFLSCTSLLHTSDSTYKV